MRSGAPPACSKANCVSPSQLAPGARRIRMRGTAIAAAIPLTNGSRVPIIRCIHPTPPVPVRPPEFGREARNLKRGLTGGGVGFLPFCGQPLDSPASASLYYGLPSSGGPTTQRDGEETLNPLQGSAYLNSVLRLTGL